MRRVWVVVIAGIAIALAVLVYFWQTQDAAAPDNQQSAQQNNNQEPERPKPPFIDLQPVIDDWAEEQNGQASVVVYDLDNDRPAGELNPDDQYFAASQYKLFVAYVGYQRVADGTYEIDEPYIGSKTRGECLDEIIRISDNPCSEKMWEELGKEKLNKLLKTKYGLENTNMVAIETSAADVAVILKRLWQGEDLTKEHRKLMLKSLKGQIHTLALPSAFSGDVTVYTKVGFSQWEDYHDTAIVTFPYDDPEGQIKQRAYVFSIVTRGVGTANIRDLAQRLEPAIRK